MIATLLHTGFPFVWHDGPVFWYDRVFAFLLGVELIEIERRTK